MPRQKFGCGFPARFFECFCIGFSSLLHPIFPHPHLLSPLIHFYLITTRRLVIESAHPAIERPEKFNRHFHHAARSLTAPTAEYKTRDRRETPIHGGFPAVSTS
jgi:hypothetical protein